MIFERMFNHFKSILLNAATYEKAMKEAKELIKNDNLK